MSAFRTGKFDHTRTGKLRNFCPVEAFDRLTDIVPADLAGLGKKLILMDVDNTLLPWRGEEFSVETRAWLEAVRAAGLQMCLISNTRNQERLKRLSEQLGIRYMIGKFKPSRDMFEQALEEFKVAADETVMVGDQLLTDVYGSNRAGIQALWVRPHARHEFLGTKVNRQVERLIRARLYRSMAEADDDLPIVAPTGIFESRVVRQFMKFCIVGGTSFVIDAGLHKLMMFHLHGPDGQIFGNWVGDRLSQLFGISEQFLTPHRLGYGATKTLSASVAILNSFLLNRRWTFSITGNEERSQQLVRFVAISVIGLVLNVLISSVLYKVLPGEDRARWLIATIIAAAVVAVWNFTGQRMWAFRRSEA